MKTNYQNTITELYELERSGIPVSIENDGGAFNLPPPGLFIQQTGHSKAIELSPYESGFAIQVRIVSNLPGPFAISSYLLELPWDSHPIILDDPLGHEPPSKYYSLGANRYNRAGVLNHTRDVRRLLTRREPMQGYLLWYSDVPIPERHVHGETVPAFIVIYSQFERPYKGAVSLHIDRTYRLIPRPPRKRRYRNITGKTTIEDADLPQDVWGDTELTNPIQPDSKASVR